MEICYKVFFSANFQQLKMNSVEKTKQDVAKVPFRRITHIGYFRRPLIFYVCSNFKGDDLRFIFCGRSYVREKRFYLFI